MAFNGYIPTKRPLTIATVHCPHEKGCIRSRETLSGVSSVFDGLPYVHHQEPLLGVHQPRFARRDGKEVRVEQFNILSHTGPFDIRLIGLSAGITKVGLPVP